MRALVLFALVVLAVPVAAQEVNCDDMNELPQQQMNYCAAMDFQKADDALNFAWRNLMRVLEGREAGMDEEFRGRPEAIRQAQRAWIAFRDAHCEAEAFPVRGGSLHPLVIATCRTELTEQRTSYLLLAIQDPY